MNGKVRRRPVKSKLPLEQRGCLYCLDRSGPFRSKEHVIPRRLGPDADRFVLPAGVVCDPCNAFLGSQIDGPFVDRFDMRLTRRLEGPPGTTRRDARSNPGAAALAP
jgi:HNH endonuclease